MTSSVVDAESVLVIDLGSVHTRANLFDVVDGRYNFIAAGMVPTSVNAPFRDLGESVYAALDQLTEITGRKFINLNHQLIIPADRYGAGIDRIVLTLSTGPELRIVAMGLLSDVSVQSAQNLAATAFGTVVENIGLNDRRTSEAKVDAIIKARPDLMIFAGGTDRGANRSVFKLAELITLVCRVLPQANRPKIIYAGNQVLSKKISEVLSKWTSTATTPNIRPSIDTEDIGPALETYSQVLTEIRYNQLGGLKALGEQSSTTPQPTSHALGRIIRFLSHLYDPKKGVLGVDLGASYTTIAAGISGKLGLNVMPLGLGQSLVRLLEYSPVEEIIKWIPIPTTPAAIQDYFWQKKIYPGSVPTDLESFYIEQAAARVILKRSFEVAQSRLTMGTLSFEPILAGGAILSGAPTPGQALLMILDGLQPIGITTILLDPHSLLSSLGAASKINSILPVQVLESGAFSNLGTVIAPYSQASFGSPILRIRLEYEQGGQIQKEIRKGTLTQLPLEIGQTAIIHLQPLRRTIIDPYGKRGSQSFKITGGICGAVIDTRGRPISLPSDDTRRRDLLKKWQSALEK